MKCSTPKRRSAQDLVTVEVISATARRDLDLMGGQTGNVIFTINVKTIKNFTDLVPEVENTNRKNSEG